MGRKILNSKIFILILVFLAIVFALYCLRGNSAKITIRIAQQQNSFHPEVKQWGVGIEKVIEKVEKRYGGRIKLAARKNNISPRIITAVTVVESLGNPKAVSRAKAMGLMQLKKETAKSVGVKNIFHPYENLYGGSLYLKQLVKQFGSLDAGLAAYNLGPTKFSIYYNNGFNPSACKYVQKVRLVLSKT